MDNEIIVRSMHTVEKEKACVAGMPVKDTIKVSDELGYSANTPDRKACGRFRHRNALNMICWLSPMISCLVTCHMGKCAGNYG